MNYRFRYIVSLIICFVLSFSYVKAQNEDKPVVVKNRTNRPNIRNNHSSNNDNTDISNSLSSFLKIKPTNIDNASWKRVLVRKINLTNKDNQALDYMALSQGKRRNLFGIIFDLFINNKINCYEYLDGVELFDKDHLVNVKDIIDKFQINNKIVSNKYVVDDVDVPSREVRSYYIKEVYYFDLSTSEFKREAIALCPVITMLNDYGEEMNIPMFWVEYDDLKPFLSNVYTSISDLNMVEKYTLSDFIDMNMYSGDIVRLGNKSLNMMSVSKDSINIIRNKIEKQLSDVILSINGKSSTNEEKELSNISKNNKSSQKNSRDKRVYSKKHTKDTKSSSRIIKSVRK